MARKISVEIVGDASSLERAFKRAGSSASGFGTKMKSAGKVAGASFAVGVGAAAIVLKKSYDAAIDAEKAQTRLDAAFKSANVSARQRAQVMESVNRVSAQAALDDEDLMDAVGRLTRVTGNAAQAQREMGIAADIARGRGIDLEAATQIVTKAHLGQLGALKRIGIEIPKVTEAQDALKASGEKVSAAQMAAAKAADETATRQAAVAALQKQYAGAAEDYGNTAAGAQERFKVAVENLQEAIGAKLLPVVSRLLEWFVRNMPTIERITTATMDKVGAVIKALGPVFSAVGDAFRFVARAAQQYWPQVQKAAQDVVVWYRTQLQPAIENVLAAIRKAWELFGPAIMRVASTVFRNVLVVVQTVMGNIKSAISIVLALIRGDWGKAWDELKAVVSRTLGAVVAIVRNVGGLVYDAAVAVGRQIIAGVVAGLTGLFDAVKDKIVGGIKGAIGAAGGILHGSGDFMFTKQAIGEPMVRGVLEGLAGLETELGKKLTDGVRAAIGKAADAVKAGRGAFADAWSSYSSAALAVFDDIASKVKTKSEQALEAMRAAREAADVLGAVTTARADLAAAQQTGDPEQIVAAQKALDDALYRQKEYGLEQRAALERAKLDEQTAVDRKKFEDWLATRSVQQQQQIAVEGKGQEDILKKIKSYNPLYRARGLDVGKHLEMGLRDAAGGVMDAAMALSDAIAKAVALGAGLGQGIRKDIEARLEGYLRQSGLPGLASGGIVTRPMVAKIAENGPEAVIPLNGRTGLGGQTVINVSFPNYVGDRNELIDEVRRGLADIARRNPGALPGVA